MPPAPVELIAAQLVEVLARVAAGTDLLGVLVDQDTDRLVGMGLLVDPGHWIFPHWRTVSRLMVHPSLRRTGAGSVLMSGLHDSARALGLEQLQLALRDGEGLQAFYERHGYREVGRWPGSLRLPDGDRDSVLMQAQVLPPAMPG